MDNQTTNSSSQQPIVFTHGRSSTKSCSTGITALSFICPDWNAIRRISNNSLFFTMSLTNGLFVLSMESLLYSPKFHRSDGLSFFRLQYADKDFRSPLAPSGAKSSAQPRLVMSRNILWNDTIMDDDDDNIQATGKQCGCSDTCMLETHELGQVPSHHMSHYHGYRWAHQIGQATGKQCAAAQTNACLKFMNFVRSLLII